MKATKTISASRMVARFDSQLKKIIMNDLKAIKAVKAQLLTNMNNEQLAA